MPDAPPVTEFKYPDAKRKNLPPAGSPPGERIVEQPKVKFAYDPHRTPALRFNERIARSRALLAKGVATGLTREEAAELAEQLESEQPWLEWAGKREHPHFEVEPVALHLHESISTQAILRAVRREDAQGDLYAPAALSAREARAYYQHDVDWANRLIVGDSLQVMTSLGRREGLAGQVQMIYLDPPYGIKFSSNWQNEVGKRDVKDKDEDLTREPEMIRAYRDTWTLGVHSYLAYLKQRLLVARELLAECGSAFIQISDENLHRVRAVMDEVFGAENYIAQIQFQKTTSATNEFLPVVADSIIWYAKNREKVKYQNLYREKALGDAGADHYSSVLLETGETRPLSLEEATGRKPLPKGAQAFTASDLSSASMGRMKGEGAACWFPVTCGGKTFRPNEKSRWKTNEDGMRRLVSAERVIAQESAFRFRRYIEDFSAFALHSLWTDVGGAPDRVYVVQTSAKIIERCMLMTTEPGDLVLDPTCGSGTTAFVAEQWGRRWITIDSSRVAAAIARQRLLTASFETYKTRDPQAGVDPNAPLNPQHGFHYRSVPHITLKSIAQNGGLDSIVARHEPILSEQLLLLNSALTDLTEELRHQLVAKLIRKLREEGARNVTDADQRRWLLPGTDPHLIQIQVRGGPSATQVRDLRAAIPPEATWREWEVPFDCDLDWPQPLQAALTAYRTAWREKMDEVNACISANAEQEDLVDQPEVVRGVVRVSGRFTVESIRPPENVPAPEPSAEDSPITGAPKELETFAVEEKARAAGNAASHIDRMLELLRHDGITFLGNKHVALSRLDRAESAFLHAEGEFAHEDGSEHRVAVVIGPEFGSVPSYLVEQAMRHCYKRGYDDLVVAGFSFDAMAQEVIQDNNDDKHTDLRVHMAQIRPDVTMGDLLKKSQVTAQIFTVFGQPRTRLELASGEEWVIHMEGVDIYDPVKNSIEATNAGKVAAWFLDTDYDGKVFCICQAFFPDKTAWDKLGRALKSSMEEGVFEKLSGTVSIPFKPGPRQTVAVKVIDPRGNEVMRVHRLNGGAYEAEG